MLGAMPQPATPPTVFQLISYVSSVLLAYPQQKFALALKTIIHIGINAIDIDDERLSDPAWKPILIELRRVHEMIEEVSHRLAGLLPNGMAPPRQDTGG